ncbi:MAG: response regulator [Campylobacterota bacterium]|nr:response regulator [Campylobacterota bacterium]
MENLKNLTVLYVEDDNEVRENISQSLSYFVKDVLSAGDGDEAYSLYEKYSPDIIITDIDMPGMNGLELAARVREDDSFIPIVVMTAYTTEEFLLDAVSLHLERYIVKPISLSKLKDSLLSCYDRLKELNRVAIKFPTGYSYNLTSSVMKDEHGEEVALQNKEKLLLELFIRKMNAIAYYSEIEDEVWDSKELNKGSLKALVVKLRKKLGKDSIINENDLGYRLSN